MRHDIGPRLAVSTVGFNIAVRYLPMIGGFVISRGAKTDAVVIMATIKH
jgi:hypothetical protein